MLHSSVCSRPLLVGLQKLPSYSFPDISQYPHLLYVWLHSQSDISNTQIWLCHMQAQNSLILALYSTMNLDFRAISCRLSSRSIWKDLSFHFFPQSAPHMMFIIYSWINPAWMNKWKWLLEFMGSHGVTHDSSDLVHKHITDLRCYVSFRCTEQWFSYTYISIESSYHSQLFTLGNLFISWLKSSF